MASYVTIAASVCLSRDGTSRVQGTVKGPEWGKLSAVDPDCLGATGESLASILGT